MVTPRELRLRASDRHRPVVCEHRAEQFQQVRRAGGRMSPQPAPMCLLLLAALGCLWHGTSIATIEKERKSRLVIVGISKEKASWILFPNTWKYSQGDYFETEGGFENKQEQLGEGNFPKEL
ncbi:unnamed protein product [Larinioides sclopetarius]|uniref:Uncharacterized protein n=1 Tax=Larinioides sclopetarius TaxID=280406 RepID=A0AAV2AZ11_9ARAC